MKKLLAVIAACLVLCGCGSKGGEQHSEMINKRYRAKNGANGIKCS